MKYIDAELLRNEIERRIEQYWSDGDVDSVAVSSELEEVLDFLDSLQQEQPCDGLEEEAEEWAEKDNELTIKDLELLHTFLYAVKNNKQGVFTFTRLSDEQYQEALKKFKENRK